jgi:hypothetical protein
VCNRNERHSAFGKATVDERTAGAMGNGQVKEKRSTSLAECDVEASEQRLRSEVLQAHVSDIVRKWPACAAEGGAPRCIWHGGVGCMQLCKRASLAGPAQLFNCVTCD